MLIAVRAEVESVDHWREKFKTHVDLFKSQGVSLAYMGAADDKTVIAVFDTNDADEFVRIFNDPATAEASAVAGSLNILTNSSASFVSKTAITVLSSAAPI